MSVSFLAVVAIVIVVVVAVAVFVVGFLSFWLDSFVLGFVLASQCFLPFCSVCKSFCSCPILRSLVLISSSCNNTQGGTS